MSHVVVVGGGITGLAAAWFLRQCGTGAGSGRRPEVTLVEAGERLGGKILTGELAGLPVEAGPDAFLARVPHAVELCRALGLAGELVPPATGHAFVWAGGRLRSLPDDLVLGVPTNLVSLARSRVLSPFGVARTALDLVLPASPLRPEGGDRSVGELARTRLGREAYENLVDALLGGIHAGPSEHLSLWAAAPPLAEAAAHRSLVLGARAHRRRAAASEEPVFLGLPAGLGRLVERLDEELRAGGAQVRRGAAATALETRPDGRHRCTISGDDGSRVELEADGVVLAVPAFSAAALLARVCPPAARELADIEYASVGLVGLVYPSLAVGHPLDGSGFLVPRSEGRLVTACSWASSKWPHLARGGQVVLRASVGRAGDERALGLDDASLIERVHSELAEVLNLTAPPQAARVSRWPAALPQYRVGHLERVARIEAALATVPGLALAGAALRGLGIPACIASAASAAASVLSQLGTVRGATGGRAGPAPLGLALPAPEIGH